MKKGIKVTSAKGLVKSIIAENPRFKWLLEELPKNFKYSDVESSLENAGYGKVYQDAISKFQLDLEDSN